MSAERIALLEDLLAKAYRSLDHSSRHDELRKAIRDVMPHPDQRLHASSGRGETWCEIDLANLVPRVQLAPDITQVNCIGCLNGWLEEYRARAVDFANAVRDAEATLAKLMTTTTPESEA